MATKFHVGDRVAVPEERPRVRKWWVGKPAIVRTVFEDMGMYEVLFLDAQDFAFIEEDLLAALGDPDPEYVTELHNTQI